MQKIIAGCLVIRDDRFAVVREGGTDAAKRGKWNIPMGHLDEGEDIIAGAVRETQEETGLTLKPEGFVGVYHHRKKNGDGILKIVLKASSDGEELSFPKDEIMDAKWISFEEFLAMPEKKLRSPDIRTVIGDYARRGALPLETVRISGF